MVNLAWSTGTYYSIGERELEMWMTSWRVVTVDQNLILLRRPCSVSPVNHWVDLREDVDRTGWPLP